MANRNFPQLDGLRGLAALVVLLHHFWPSSAHWDPTGGRFAVDIFFVLSGYLITRTLLRARGRPPFNAGGILGRFFKRRALRLFPVLYLTLIWSMALRSERQGTFLWHASFLSNIYFIVRQRYVGAGAHLWALAVEQHFYLFWPFVMLLIPRRHLRATAWGMIATGLFFRALAGALGWSNLTIDVMTPGVFEALGCGALLADRLESCEEIPQRGALAWMGLLGLAFIILRPVLESTPYGVWESLMTTEWSRSLLIAWLLAQAVWGLPGWLGRVLQSTVARALGAWSYSVYISHNFIYGAFKAWGGCIAPLDPHNTQALLALAVTLVYSGLCYRYIEKPLAQKFT